MLMFLYLAYKTITAFFRWVKFRNIKRYRVFKIYCIFFTWRLRPMISNCKADNIRCRLYLFFKFISCKRCLQILDILYYTYLVRGPKWRVILNHHSTLLEVSLLPYVVYVSTTYGLVTVPSLPVSFNVIFVPALRFITGRTP